MKQAAYFFFLFCLFGGAVADTVDSARATQQATVDTLKSDTITTDTANNFINPPRVPRNEVGVGAADRFEKKPQIYPFFYHDTLLAYFASERFDMSFHVKRSYYHDASDYFRFHPGYFTLTHQITPMRATVQPYGLAGDRMGIVLHGNNFQTFEHIVEPDGMIDFTDLPTTFDDRIYILPAGSGAVFGGRNNGIATLVTQADFRDTAEPLSSFLVDKGSYGYSFARGRYMNRFRSGRDLNLSIGYRTTEGYFFSRGYDSYMYNGELFEPLGSRYGLQISGTLLDVEGFLAVRPDIGGATINRDRYDRSLNVGFLRHNNQGTNTVRIGYSHLRSGSALAGAYRATSNWSSHGGYFSREWMQGVTVLKGELNARRFEFVDGLDEHSRHEGEASISIGRLSTPSRWALRGVLTSAEGSSPIPSLAGVWMRETRRFSLTTSLVYQGREPSLLELFHRRRSASLYGSGTTDYIDQGNSNLKSERQIVGSIDISFGSMNRGLVLSLAGGKLSNGIEWSPAFSADTLVFSTINSNIDFGNATIRANYDLNSFATASVGGSYYNVKYDKLPSRAYTPDYMAFSAVELHLPWNRKKIEFYGYGEFLFIGPYEGYNGRLLGEVPVFNSTLAFRMSNFRFHFVIQNIFSYAFESRERFQTTGRFNYFGFVWNFVN